MRVVIGTGGTAGHIFPALVLAAHLRESAGADVRFIGRSVGQEAAMVPAAGFPLDGVDALPFQRSVSLRAFRAPIAAIRAAQQARPLIRSADVAVAMGGYVSVPVILAARRERASLVVHEQNAIPGLANRMAARWAAAVALGFADAARHLPRRSRSVVTGNPIRPSLLRAAAERAALAEEARRTLGLEAGRRTVLIFGGSQGALRLNRAAVDAAHLLRDRGDLQLLILTGARDHDEVRQRLPNEGALVVRAPEYLDRIEMAYALADLAVTRAGAMTIAELTACGIPSVLVPYPYATAGHQEANARAVERAGGALVMLDDQIDGRSMAGQVTGLLGSADRLRAMTRAARSFGRPDATEALASVVLSVARGVRR